MKLPFVISVPHASHRVPPHLAEAMALDQRGIEESADRGTMEVFARLPALKVVAASWSRLVVDLNRSPEERGTKGIIAERDYSGRDVFLPGRYPDQDQVEQLIQEYYQPYHQELEAALAQPGVLGLVDGHSLDGVGPHDAPDSGEVRADLVLGNNGGPDGEPDPNRGGITCPPQSLRLLASGLADQGFSVALNQPYAGGFITRHYGQALMARGGLAVQIEMNKNLLVEGDSWGVDPAKAAQVRTRLQKALAWFGAQLEA